MATISTTLPELKQRIESREARIGIVGMGYVGLPLALLFSAERFRVTGFDIAESKVETLNSGGSYIVRILPESIQEAQKSGFRATSDYSEVANMDAVIICVPTPLNEYHEPDLSYVTGTVQSIAPYVHEGQIIILESTTYPGTTEEIVVPLLEKGNPHGLKVARAAGDAGFHVAFSPEREDPGNDTVARHDIPKVVGGCDPGAVELSSAMYGSIFRRVVPVSSPAVAEMTKLLENIYRCVNIALVNELKQLCMRMGIDIHEVIDAAKTKPFGFQAFYPGPGLGGHCIPIDPFYLSWKAKEFDFRTRFIELAGEVNIGMPYFVIEQTAAALNDHRKAMKGSKILVLGLCLQEGHRRPARVALAHHHRAAPPEGRRSLVQRSVLPARGPRPPLRPRHGQHAARQHRAVRRRPHRHRPLDLRLPGHRQPRAARHRLAQRHQRHKVRQDRPLLIAQQIRKQEGRSQSSALLHAL